ncbi:MAG: crosslink repair DNA glycosylase YcaQ family protein [Acidimicrobiales bacterium]|nr:crosslink repair DNA glycosylase YcaQ family protein [Acidimicrobiales bacterium]
MSLSASGARRVALYAQGFCDPQPTGRVDVRHFRRVMSRIGLLQLDSVQVVCRSHYLPVYSRLGVYDRDRLDIWLWKSGELFETWSHEASVVPVDLEPILRWFKDLARSGQTWPELARMASEDAEYVMAVLNEVRVNGPIAAGDLSDPRPREGSWWDGRSDGKRAMDWLFRIGEVGSRRTGTFERTYETFAGIVPPGIRALPSPSEGEAKQDLLEIAARCCGVGTAADLADYFRIKTRDVRLPLSELVESGRLVAASVEGWQDPAFLHPDAVCPQTVRARALLSPFDPVVWFRPRAERLFGFRYRIEIYVPQPKREYGYYVLPFLLGDQLVGRVDVKADRQARRLMARGVFAEADVDREHVATELSVELDRLAEFLGMDGVDIGERGNLASALRSARR